MTVADDYAFVGRVSFAAFVGLFIIGRFAEWLGAGDASIIAGMFGTALVWCLDLREDRRKPVSDSVQFMVICSEKEYRAWEALATSRGFTDLNAYLRSLVERDARLPVDDGKVLLAPGVEAQQSPLLEYIEKRPQNPVLAHLSKRKP